LHITSELYLTIDNSDFLQCTKNTNSKSERMIIITK
jgi:hypothetical protein